MPSSCFCEALATNRECYELDLSNRPAWGTDMPVISVFAGSEDLRRLTISFYERAEQDGDLSCAQIAHRKRCDPLAVFEVGFAPAGGTLVLDGQIGRAIVECGGNCETSTSVWGAGGASPTWLAFDCASICVCLETDALLEPAEDARLTIGLTARGY